MGLFAPIRDYIETLVHPSAQQDVLTAARHRAFIAPRLARQHRRAGVVSGLSARPRRSERRRAAGLCLAGRADPHRLFSVAHRPLRERPCAVFAGADRIGDGALPRPPAVSRRLPPSGLSSCRSRRRFRRRAASSRPPRPSRLPPPVYWCCSARSICCRRPAPSAPAALAALGIVSAALYATGLALGAEALARTSFWLLYAEEDRYRLLARNMTDVITRHGRDGAVLFVSPAAERCLDRASWQLHGHGLFERVHVADRPAYLTALGDAAAFGETAFGRIPRAARRRRCRRPARRRNSSGSRCAAGRCEQTSAIQRRRIASRGRRGVARRDRAQSAAAGADRRACRGGARQCRARAVSSPP